jgi:hypothetical protein
MFLNRTTYSPIGIDAGSRAVSAVQFARDAGIVPGVGSARSWKIHAATSIPRASSAEDLSPGEFLRILAALRRQGFVGTRAVSAVPLTKAFSSVLELPAHAPNAAIPLDAIARQELARTCKRDPSSIECAWWELPSSPTSAGAQRSGASALAIGCAHADATALLDCLEVSTPSGSSTLDILALDTAPTALARACAPLLSAPPGLTAILSLSHEAAQILILRGDLVVYERTLAEAGLRLLLSGVSNQIGTGNASPTDAAPGGSLAEHILTTYGVNPPPPDADTDDGIAAAAPDACALVAGHADALASELTASMTYAARRFDSSLATVILTGSGAAIPGLAKRVGERAGLQPIIASPGELFPAVDGLEPATLGPAMTLAAGLALYDEATPARAKRGVA